MIQYIRPIHIALIIIAMSAPHISFSMVREEDYHKLNCIETDTIYAFAHCLESINPTWLAIPEDYDDLEQSKIMRYRQQSFKSLHPVCKLLQESDNPHIRALLIKGCANEIKASILKDWATHNLSSKDPRVESLLVYIKSIAQEALKIKIASAPEINTPANCPQLPNTKQPLSFFAKCSIAAGTVGAVTLVYYWYTRQKETQKA